MTVRHQHILADFGLLYASAIWGTTFVVVRDVLPDIHPVTLVGYRFLLAALLLAGFQVVTRRPVLAGFRRSIAVGFMLWLLYVPQTIGLGITTAANSGFITGTFVLFVPLFMRPITGHKPTAVDMLASLVSLTGLGILTGGLTRMNVGDAITLITALAYALHMLMADKAMKAGSDPYSFSSQQFFFVGALSLVISAIGGFPLTVGSTSAIWTVVFLAVFPTLSAFLIQMLAQKIATPVKVALIFALEPLFAGIFAWTVGGEQPTWYALVGGTLIFGALVLHGLVHVGYQLRRSREQAPGAIKKPRRG